MSLILALLGIAKDLVGSLRIGENMRIGARVAPHCRVVIEANLVVRGEYSWIITGNPVTASDLKSL